MRAEKKYLIDEVTGHLKKSEYVIVANYDKMSVEDVANLRTKLAPEKAEFHVVKNSSFRVAAKAFGLPDMESVLKGPTAIVVGGKNPYGIAKIVKKYFTDTQKLEIKTGVIDKKSYNAKEMSQLAELPSFDALRSQLLGLLMQPAAAFVRVVDAKVKKEQPAA